jgi:hypothetical protein
MSADLLSLRLGGWVRAFLLPGGGAPLEVLVQRSWVVLAVVPSLNGEARMAAGPCSGCPAPDRLERARLDGGGASWWWRRRLGGVSRQRLDGQHIAAGRPELYGPI